MEIAEDLAKNLVTTESFLRTGWKWYCYIYHMYWLADRGVSGKKPHSLESCKHLKFIPIEDANLFSEKKI